MSNSFKNINTLWLFNLALFVCSLTLALPAHSATTIRVGVFDNKPIVFQQNNQYTGFSLDVLESIAENENWQLQYVHGPWKSVLKKLESGEIDLLVGIAYKPERAKLFDFTNETLINNWGVVYRHPSVSVTSLKDLQNKRIALMSRSIHSRVFKQMMDKFQFEFTTIEVKNYLEGLKVVDANKADAVIINRVFSIINASDYDVMETGVIFNPVEVRFASPKGKHADILATIDRHMAAQKENNSSAYHVALKKWLGSPQKFQIPEWLYYSFALLAVFLMVMVISNVLIRKQVLHRTAELTESELRFRQLAENINDVFWISSPDWQQIFYVSPTFEKIWQKKCAELYQNPMSWLDSVHPDDVEKVKEDIIRKSSGNLQPPEIPEYRIVSSDGSVHWILARAYPIYDENNNIIRIAGIAENITERKKAEDTIHFMAFHDSLTRLSNRNAFEHKLLTAIEHARTHDTQHVLMYIDLDQFKIVNDTCGHSAGDAMLHELASILDAATKEGTTLARLGGDEFGVLVENATLENGLQKAQEFLDIIQDYRFSWDKKKFSLGASIGLVMIGETYKPIAELLSSADMACYAAKETGRNRIQVYSDDDADLAQRHGEMQWVSRIKTAIEEDLFILYRQSIVPLQGTDNKHSHFEYLLRMVDENNNIIMPNTFLPAAERFDLMTSLDKWVVTNVFKSLSGNTDNGTMSFINLSGQVFTDDSFAEHVINSYSNYNINPATICFEVTETVAIGNLDKAINFIKKLKQEGFYFALDDFGTGMSSFSYLRLLPIDFLKIDGFFIKELLNDPMNLSIVEAITRIGHTSELKIIAEWVEDKDIYNKLIEIGIDYAQGYVIDKPQALTSNNS